jgi:hypothetical protein
MYGRFEEKFVNPIYSQQVQQFAVSNYSQKFKNHPTKKPTRDSNSLVDDLIKKEEERIRLAKDREERERERRRRMEAKRRNDDRKVPDPISPSPSSGEESSDSEEKEVLETVKQLT